MALLGGWLSAEGREERAVQRALTEISERKIPVRLESEQSGISFFTVVSLRSKVMVLARPRVLRGGLPKGSFVRLTLPNLGRKQVRAPVVVGNLKLPFTLKRACISEVPHAFCGVCRRSSDRFHTARFKNLFLQLEEAGKTFRVVDLSTSGVRIYTGEDTPVTLFEPGAELVPARFRLGGRVQIELQSLVTRAVNPKTVGLELQVRRDGASERFLMNLLNRLQESELRRLQIEPS